VKYHGSNAVGKLGPGTRADLKHWHGAPQDSALHAQRGDCLDASVFRFTVVDRSGWIRSEPIEGWRCADMLYRLQAYSRYRVLSIQRGLHRPFDEK
jgi:hypothetical protein